MVTYPIQVKRAAYRGNDKRKRQQTSTYNADAVQLENYCNELVSNQEEAVAVYDWWEIARGCGLSVDRVAELGYSIAGGSNGFTAARRGMSISDAIAAVEKEA